MGPQPHINLAIIRKYNKALPRYTSYPTVPNWKEELDKGKWLEDFTKVFESQNHVNGISLYIHLPFCESLCTYCGCNKKITTNHSVEETYIDAVLKEWALYKKLMKQTPVIREIHLGGGTPTFFSPANLKKLIDSILKGSIVHPHREFSIEGHPNNTSAAHLKTLFNLGFRRISYGVQDNDPEVQRVINRIQPVENVRRATEQARSTGFESVNFDLIYGLPLQTIESIERTINEVITLRPDRIAFYSYAHVPWTSKGQRLFDETSLPSPEQKLQIYLKGKELLQAAGYADIGMDHFALPTDPLYIAWEQKRLHRNFMGYTTQRSGLLLGLGVSSISDTGTAFAQNEKALHDYYMQINSGNLATKKGYILSAEDKIFQKYILDLSCKGSTSFNAKDLPLLETYTFPILTGLEQDQLIEWNRSGMKITSKGENFIRNICSAFDLYLQRSTKENLQFSKAI